MILLDLRAKPKGTNGKDVVDADPRAEILAGDLAEAPTTETEIVARVPDRTAN
jgi:hypothetical protein